MKPCVSNPEWRIKFFKDLQKRFFKLERRVSIVVQGPLHERSIRTIPDYLKYGDVVISCWDKDDLSLLKEYRNKVTLVVNKYEDVPRSRLRSFGRHGPNPWILQNYSSYQGVKAAKGFFAIKVRSDESYPDLEAIVKKLYFWNEDTEFFVKFITSDIYFRFDKDEPFHPSDHIIAGKRDQLKRGFKRALFNSRAELQKKYAFPERLICESFLESIWDHKAKCNISIDIKKSKELMKKYFDIVPIRLLKGFAWSSSYRKYEGLKQPEAGWCQDINGI